MEINKKYIFILLIAGFIFCTGSMIIRHYSLRTYAYDTGYMAGVARNAALHLSYFSDVGNANYMSQHFSPALILPGFLFYIWDNPCVMFIFQNLCIFVSIYLSYILAQIVLGERKWAILLSIVFALNYYLNNVNGSGDHIETLGLPLFLSLFIFIESPRSNTRIILITLISLLILSIKEDLVLTLGFFGVWASIFKKGKMIESIIIAMVGLIGFYFISSILIPHFAGGVLMFSDRYSNFGSSANEILSTVLKQPQKVLLSLIMPPIKLVHIFSLFLSFWMLPFVVTKVTLTTLPPILIHSLSSYRSQYAFAGQYSLPAIPFLYYSSIYGWKKLCDYFANKLESEGKRHLKRIVKFIIILTLLSSIVPLIQYGSNYAKFNLKRYTYFNNNIKPLIPRDSRLVSPNHIQPQFLKNRYSGILSCRESMATNPDYVILSKDRIPTYWQKDDYTKFTGEILAKYPVIFEDSTYAVLKITSDKEPTGNND